MNKLNKLLQEAQSFLLTFEQLAGGAVSSFSLGNRRVTRGRTSRTRSGRKFKPLPLPCLARVARPKKRQGNLSVSSTSNFSSLGESDAQPETPQDALSQEIEKVSMVESIEQSAY